jgi:hypothetical protein
MASSVVTVVRTGTEGWVREIHVPTRARVSSGTKRAASIASTIRVGAPHERSTAAADAAIDGRQSRARRRSSRSYVGIH